MRETESIARSRASALLGFRARSRASALLGGTLLAFVGLGGCGHTDPCRASVDCAGERVCGLAGACVAGPSAEEALFAAQELRALIEDGAPDRLVLGEDAEPVELAFGPLPQGKLASAVLRLSPYPSATPQADAIARVRRGRRSVEAHYALGRDAPLLVDVSELLEGARPGDVIALSVTMRAEAGATFEASSPRSAEPRHRPTLTLVLR